MTVSRRSILTRAAGAAAVGAVGMAGTARPAAAAVTGASVNFDTFFTGATDDAKIQAMNAWHSANTGAGSRPAVTFAARTYTFSTSIGLYSGMNLQGARGPVREYNTGTVFAFTGGNCFTYVSSSGYGYPSAGAPRDITIEAILFNGGSQRNWLEPVTSYSTSRVLWMSTIRDCGWTNWKTIMNGYFDGVTVDGVCHVQGCYGTPFTLRGSECNIFADGYSFIDSATAYPITNGLPYLECQLSKSKIGRVMISSRNAAYAVLVSGGSNTVFDGTAFDAPDSVPTYGAAVRVTGGDGIVFQGCSFKGMMTNPSAAAGGSAANRGWVNVSGGAQVVLTNNQFRRAGNNVPSTTVPAVYADSSVGSAQVKIGMNAFSGYGGASAHVAQATSGKIVTCDPSLSVDTAPSGSGAPLRSTYKRRTTQRPATAQRPQPTAKKSAAKP